MSNNQTTLISVYQTFSLVSLASSARQSSQYTREENTLAPAIAIGTENRTKKYEQMQ
jgi:hypothetical protein